LHIPYFQKVEKEEEEEEKNCDSIRKSKVQ